MQQGTHGCFLLAEYARDLCGGIALVVEQMDGLAVFGRQGTHRIPHEREVTVRIVARIGFFEFCRVPEPRGMELVLAQVDGNAQQPCLFVRRAFQRGCGTHELHECVLKHILGIAAVVQIRIRRSEYCRSPAVI